MSQKVACSDGHGRTQRIDRNTAFAGKASQNNHFRPHSAFPVAGGTLGRPLRRLATTILLWHVAAFPFRRPAGQRAAAGLQRRRHPRAGGPVDPRSVDPRGGRGDFELLLHDDGSTDGSPGPDPGINAPRPADLRDPVGAATKGLGAAMTRLAERARGDYCAVQEQDDVSLPGTARERARRARGRSRRSAWSPGIAEWVDDDGAPFRLFPGLLAGGGQYPQEPVGDGALPLPRAVQGGERRRPFPPRSAGQAAPGRVPVFFDAAARMSVDWQFFLRLAHSWKIVGLPRVVVRMQRGDGRDSLTRRKDLQFAEARRCLRLLYDELAGSPALADRRSGSSARRWPPSCCSRPASRAAAAASACWPAPSCAIPCAARPGAPWASCSAGPPAGGAGQDPPEVA